MALVGRLLCLALISAGLGTATLTTLEPAAAADGDGPTAIAVGPAGTSYVGFAAGGRLRRLSPQGKRQGTVQLDQSGPVDGLFVNAAGQIWVDYGTSVSLLAPDGRVLEHLDHDPGSACAGSPATRYGGITVGGGRVWVANRCAGTMTVYSQRGRRIATVDLPGRGHPRGITYGVAQSGRAATVYVALPDSGRIVGYRANRVSDASRPSRSFAMRRPAGGTRPSPGGIAVDRFGQLTVADLANNAIFLLDTNHDFNVYRTLGHPPRASRAVGRLSSPSAIAQHAQDRGSLSGNLFIADTGNRRVQRWNTSGWTYWATTARAGADDPVSQVGPDAGPVNTAPPAVVGSGSVGTALTCSPGSWSSAGSVRYSYAWSRNGVPIAHTASSQYVVLNADIGSLLGCTVTATNSRASASTASAGRMIAGPSGHAPANLTAPTISGEPVAGHTLTCDPGTWTGSPSSMLALWQRDGATVANGSWTYVVSADDAGAALQCVVVAANGWGSGVARSAPAAPGACGGAGGVEIDGGATGTTSPYVTLTLRAPRGTSTVRISNDPSFTAETVVALPADCTYDWVLPSVPGMPLTWPDYVRYGGDGATSSDSIVVNEPS
jgi:sugar lactone lactonase YvrE